MMDESFGDEGSYVSGSPKNDVPPVRLEPGEIVPGTRYRIERWLGEGGVGVVYECRHVDIERRVALKVLKASVSPNTAKLFRDEALAASRTSSPRPHGTDLQFGSPYVVEIFDFGEFPDGRLWFAMELLHGRSLSAALKREGKPVAMPPNRALGILRQLCKGLHTAHKAGYIHRDIKPANIMLTRRAGRDDFVKIVDFGVSAAATADGSSGRSIMVGTPQYMAPEQTEGKPFDERLDVYAVGCVAYRMFTGRLPFVSPQLFRLMRMQREDPPLPPTEIEPELPPAIERVVLKCLGKAPEDRYRDMADLEAALCEAQIEAKLTTPWDGLPLPDVDQERRARLLKGMPRRNAGPTGARRWWPAVAALAIAAGTIGFSSFGGEPPPAAVSNGEVEQLVAQARASGARAHWVYPAVDQPDGPTSYTKVRELDEVDSPEARVAAEELRQEFAEALSALGDRYWVREHGKAFAMDYYAQAQLFDPEVGHAAQRAALTVGELALLRQQAETLSFDEAALRASQPLIALAEEDEEVREEKLRRVIAEATPRATTTEERLAGLLDEEADPPVAKSSPAKDKRPANREPTPAEPDEPIIEPDDGEEPERPSNRESARSLAQQGQAALAKADRGRAEQLFNRALAEDSRNATALFGLMRIQYDRGAYGKAAKYGRKAVAVAPNNAAYRLKLGDAYFKNFQYDDARTQYKKAKSLGSKQATERLDKIDAKIAGG